MSELETDEQRLERLRLQVSLLPKRPGVYFMRAKNGEVIYVGKAKDLRNRVKNYFSGQDERHQIEFLVRRICVLETIVTETENQAFILERDLISKHKPRYNIRLKDDKEYLHIRLDRNAPWPRLELVRKRADDGAYYYGPYGFSYELRALLDVVRSVVPLRTCNNTVFHNRTRPCLEYQIKRCAGPCCLPVARELYDEWLDEAQAILEGRRKDVAKNLEKRMERASEELEFEEAAILRDRLQALSSAKDNNAFVLKDNERRDVFSLYRDGAQAIVAVLRVRGGRIFETKSYSFQELQISDGEVLEGVLDQFYDGGRDIPPEIIVAEPLENQSILASVFSERSGSTVAFFTPERGVKSRLLGLAQMNAQQQYITQFEAEAENIRIAAELSRILKLKQVPRRIECADISNLQGSDIVGAIVVFFDGKPDKTNYRKYTISFQDKPNDFAAMNEVVTRRLKGGREDGNLPDLLIIDGGLGQLDAALRARNELGIAVDIVSLAKIREIYASKKAMRGTSGEVEKKPERIFVEGSRFPIELTFDAPTTHFVQRIRDEVHRFVITFHRQKRAKRFVASKLDSILGVGPDKRGRLLRAFGSVEEIAKASPEEVAKNGRMPISLALKVLNTLKPTE